MDASSSPERAAPWTFTRPARGHSRWTLSRWTLARRKLTRWTLALQAPCQWTPAQDGPPSDSGAGPRQGGPPRSRAGEWCGRPPEGLHGRAARTAVVAASAVVRPLVGSSARAGAAGAPLAAISTHSAAFRELFANVAELCSALASAGACVQEVIKDMIGTICEPPRRPFEENGAGTWLFWAMDVAVVFLILAACLFLLGFATMPREGTVFCVAGTELTSNVLALDGVDEEEDVVRRIIKGTRMFVAVTLPVFSSGLLSVKHWLVPALLSGL
ncbi:unnamed protein product [Prorocentrum cordatum]|uniref:H(+)-exporting diphosphatase n=1 Tax=Prorocentrum cordatum TaxID=2364126 RepID=A0ABN9VS44_9DINO|nr:unnamed protein product [Polarella glacialis]